jgi:hypothetical protein
MTGAEELYALPSALLRKELFNLFLYGTQAESKLAAECLIAVDESEVALARWRWGQPKSRKSALVRAVN